MARWRRVAGAAALVLAAVGLTWLLLGGGGDDSDSEEGEPVASAEAPPATSGDPGEPAAGKTPEELVEGVMLVGFEGSDPKAALDQLGGRAYGGVLVGPGNWPGRAAGAKLLAQLRDELGSDERDPPLLVTRQEGGPYRSLADLPPELRAIEVGDEGRPKLARAWGEDTAKALRDVGFDLNLAPVADIATLDSPIADRAFSDAPEVTTEMTVEAVKGCRDAGLACAVSHFPGLGAASQDTAVGPASISLDATTLADRDIVPFRAAFAEGAPATVVSNGLYVAYDPVVPGSLSPAVVNELLRESVGFEGVAISDDIGAGAIEAVADPGEAAVQAVNAGIDLVQVADPGDVDRVREALLRAVEDGEVDPERLREAAARLDELRRASDEDEKKKKKG